MVTDLWPSRLSMAMVQLARGTFEYPRSQASWSSVARRSLVLCGFTAYALFSDQLDPVIFAAFGALQIGLSEAALPFRTLVRLVLLSTLGVVVVAGVGLLLNGTWWTLLLLTVVAFLQGASFGAGVIPRTVGIGALAMGVIFSGIDADPATATLWLAIGSITQGVFWLVMWAWERKLSVRQSLGNAVAKIVEMVRQPGVSGSMSNAAATEVATAISTIKGSGVQNQTAALRVTDALTGVRRTVVAWREIQDPGMADRLEIIRRLERMEINLSETPKQLSLPDAWQTSPGDWPIEGRLHDAITELEDAVDHLNEPDPGPVEATPPGRWSIRRSLRPGTEEFRHGVRMATAIAAAQTLALLLPITHSFWIPLTCVFVVKPDLAFTLTRSTSRVTGNMLAVLLVPAFMFVAGSSDLKASIVVLIVSAFAFRFFTGNYILGSFGIAGTILILDQLLDHDPNLYVSRITSTLIGAAVGVLVAALIPAWRSHEALRLLNTIADEIRQTTRKVTQGLLDPAHVDESALMAMAVQERDTLIHLRPAAEAAMLEPRPEVDPRFLAVAVDAVARAHLTLLALGLEAFMRRDEGQPGLDIRKPAADANAAFSKACDALGVAVDAATAVAPSSAQPPRSPEDEAVLMGSIRLAQAAEDFAQAVEWITQSEKAKGLSPT